MADEMELDFQSVLRVAGISIPQARYAIMLEAYRSYRTMALVLDEPTPYGDEPAVAPHPERSPIR